MSSLTVNYLGIPMASPVIGASGTVGYGLELAEYIDMKKIGALSGKGLAPTPWKGNEGVRVATQNGRTVYYPRCQFCGAEVRSLNYISRNRYTCDACRPYKALFQKTGLRI